MNYSDRDGVTLITGGSGYLGGLIVEAMLRDTDREIVILSRGQPNLENLLEPVRIERTSKGGMLSTREIERVSMISYDSIESIGEIKKHLLSKNVTEIIHSAGCLEYFNIEELEKVNVSMTERLLELAAAVNLERFVYVSTAYSSGYIDGMSMETLHENPVSDPTDYTRTKREAEWLAANSKVPCLIVRPSIVIGHSRSGRYSGKRYGLYQQWMGLERLLCDRYHEEMHIVASKKPLNVLHQDSFQNGFMAAYKSSYEFSVVHLVSKESTAPTMRQLWDMWLNDVARPERVYYYQKLEDVPLATIHNRQRAYLMFASVNLEIGAHNWQFSTKNLDLLKTEGMVFTNATLDSVAICQNRFIQSSIRVQKFIENNRTKMSSSIRVIDVPDSMSCQAVS